MSATRFLREYWQKKPLLIRNAIPGFHGLLSPKQVFDLACRENVESRLVIRQGSRWRLRHGPFDPSRFARPPRGRWTVLVQGLNLHLPAAERLLMRFNFIPYSRLDDVMVSYAPPGGGVGPHFDSYDVFLLQGMGRRLWQVGAQADRELLRDAPLRILSRFTPEQEWELEPGDMLYLPPHYAHNGVAVDRCMTYSIGFRAPDRLELASRFLDFLQERLPDEETLYADPDLLPSRNPANIPPGMIGRMSDMVGILKWHPDDIRRFIGLYLSEPKHGVVFPRPSRPLRRQTFFRRRAQLGLRLTPATLMLYSGLDFYLNGEHYRVDRHARAVLARLADNRELPAGCDPGSAGDLLYEAYRCGYLLLGGHER